MYIVHVSSRDDAWYVPLSSIPKLRSATRHACYWATVVGLYLELLRWIPLQQADMSNPSWQITKSVARSAPWYMKTCRDFHVTVYVTILTWPVKLTR
jgi:hypothetical protein